MTDPLIKLAARCEAETAGSRELDGLIFKAVEERPGDVWTLDVGDNGVWMRQDREDRLAYDTPRQFTASIDAAMTLVPEGAEWECGTAHLINRAWANVITTDRNAKGNAATPALALCAASLRARAHLQRHRE